MSIHFVIPDTQVKSGVATDHLSWIGQYIVDQLAGKPDVKIIHLGDHWDMPSLSSYDKAKRAMEGRRYDVDVDAGNAGFARLAAPLEAELARRVRRRHKSDLWMPELHFIRGNHEYRVTRATETDPKLFGKLSMDDMDTRGWKVHEFLEPEFLDGVGYSHYWYNPMSGQPYGGMIETRIKNVGHSFTMGHQQTLLYGLRYTSKGAQHGLVAGACYLHDEEYKGPQGNRHWRGVIVCHQVEDGSYDPMFVSLDYLCRRYEGVSLAEFMEGRP